MNYLKQKAVQALATLAALMLMLLTPGCQPTGPLLDRIQQKGKLVVATRHDPSTYFEVQDDIYSGFEYNLVNRYASTLGVDVEWRTYDDLGEMLHDLSKGRVQLVAAGISITPSREKRFHFTPAYTEAVPVVVHHKQRKAPKTLDDLTQGRLVVSAQSAHAEKLQKLKEKHPHLSWDERSNLSPVALLSLVEKGEADFVVLNDNVFEQVRSLFPNLNNGLPLGKPHPLAWALSRHEDASLLLSLQTFFKQVEEDGYLAQLREQYFSDRRFDYVGARTFLTHIDARLPRYEPTFKHIAEQVGFDWRLLAAVAYQESMWNPNAVSPTGVTGLMMLTTPAAKEMGVTDRRNARQSIVGGSRYFKMLYDRMPDTIAEPHRTWFALAAYNMGLGHLMDARRLTKSQGADPDNWFEVEKRIPLLLQPAYYRTARHGFSRSARQAVAYVRNVRHYYETLVWSTVLPVEPYSSMPETIAALPKAGYVL